MGKTNKKWENRTKKFKIKIYEKRTKTRENRTKTILTAFENYQHDSAQFFFDQFLRY
jgi:actin-related protein